MELCFERIMTKEVLFYSGEFKDECKIFCKERNITYLPCKNDYDECYTLEGDKFKQKKFEKSQRVCITDIKN
jgi:hypothetical protein